VEGGEEEETGEEVVDARPAVLAESSAGAEPPADWRSTGTVDTSEPAVVKGGR
jgi:hypothetical protein